jgi:signal transduction histidine kinase
MLARLKRISDVIYGGPAAGAVAIAPLPWVMAFRWALVPAFALYAISGNVRDTQFALFTVLPVLSAYNIIVHWRFHRANGDQSRLLGTWAVVLVVDMAMVSISLVFARHEVSPISLLVVALLAEAVAMFRPQFVVALAIWAALFLVAADSVGDWIVDEVGIQGAIWEAVVILIVATFLAHLCSQIVKGRQGLVAAEWEAQERSAIAQEALASARVSQDRLDAIVRNSPALIALFNRNATPVFVNQHIVDVIGLPARRLLKFQTWAELVAREDVPAVVAALNDALNGKVSQIEFGARAAGGEHRRFLTVFFPVSDGLAAIAVDVTQEHAMRDRMVRMAQLEMLGTLAGGVAHDFNNLLSAVLGNLWLIDRSLPPDSPLRELTAAAREASDAGAELVRQLLEYSRPQAAPFETVDVADIIDTTLRMARGALRGIEIEIVPAEVPVLVRGQPGALQQVFLNLVMNARDAMPNTGRITFACIRKDGSSDRAVPAPWTIQVMDNGPGIEPSQIKRIFDPFYTTKDPGKGTGLGLAMVDMIIRNHGGSVTVESRPGRTAFSITLPAATGPKPDPRAAAPVPMAVS